MACLQVRVRRLKGSPVTGSTVNRAMKKARHDATSEESTEPPMPMEVDDERYLLSHQDEEGLVMWIDFECESGEARGLMGRARSAAYPQ